MPIERDVKNKQVFENLENAQRSYQTETEPKGYRFIEYDKGPAVHSELMNSAEAAGFLKCSIKTLYNYKCEGKIKSYSVGGRSGGSLRFKKSDLEAFLFGKRGT